MAEGFHLQVERRDDDYRAFRRQVAREARMRPHGRGISWSCGAVAAVIAMALMAVATQGEPRTIGAAQFAMLFLSFFGAWWLLLWIVEPVVADRLYPPLRIFRAPLSVALDGGGIHLSSAFASQSLRWPAISDLIETRSHIFLRVDGASAVVIPKRAFDAALPADGFVKEVDGHLAAVRAGQA